jgi:hypothetical protein
MQPKQSFENLRIHLIRTEHEGLQLKGTLFSSRIKKNC